MSLPTTLDLEIVRGDPYAHQLKFIDDQIPPQVWDLREMTFKAQIRDRPEQGTVLYAEFDIDTTDAEFGIIVLGLTAGQTRIPPGFWDLEIDGETYYKGSVTMSGDVTQGVTL